MDNFDASNLVQAIVKLGTNSANTDIGALELVAFEITKLKQELEKTNEAINGVRDAIVFYGSTKKGN